MTMSKIEFRVCGPVEVIQRDRPVDLGGPRGRGVVAALLLEANRVVSVDHLVAAVWSGEPPSTARVQIQNRVSQLRRAFAARDAPDVIVTSGSGYRINVDDGQLDAQRFDRLVADADTFLTRADHAGSRTALSDALSLWRGAALDGLLAPTFVAAARRLEERRAEAEAKRIELDLHAGRAAEVLPELTTLVTAHPYRERLRGYQMLALFRAGRRAEALQVFREMRGELAEQLGIDPGPDLQRLHESILRGDERRATTYALRLIPVTLATPAVIPSARAVRVPRQLPADVAAFTGRGLELDVLDSLLADDSGEPATSIVISVVAGTPGVGKTALAVHWAHRVADGFPDGQLYVNLRGYDPDLPLAPADVLVRFLTALGIAESDMPHEIDDLAARYRSLVAYRRMLVVLDNASSVEQVRPLLPGSGSCTVVVTSRDTLAGLVARDGARRIDLDLMPAADAQALLRRLIDDRVDSEPEAAAALAELAARLPLALRLVAELAVTRPTTPLAALAAELSDLQYRLTHLDPGGDPHTAVTAVFSWSVRQLAPPAARVFALLGLHPGGDFDAYAAAALADLGLRDARRALDQLARAYLVRRLDVDRYSMHDLLRAYAAQLASSGETRQALGRLFDYYLATASAAIDHLYPADADRRPRVNSAATPVPVLADLDAARTWLEAERRVLTATAAYTATRGWPTHAVQLSSTLARYLGAGYLTDALLVHGNARSAARQIGDQAGEVRATASLGATEFWLGRFEPAAEHLRAALAGFREVGDEVGAARTLGDLGNIDLSLGRYDAALDHHRRARLLLRRAGDRSGEAVAVSNTGTTFSRLEQFTRSAAYHRRACALFREAGNAAGEAQALNNLGGAEQRLGRYKAAERHLLQSLDLHRRAGNRSGEGSALFNLGAVEQRLGRYEAAEAHLRYALDLHRQTGFRFGEALCLDRLGRVLSRVGRHKQAADCGREAIDLFRAVSDKTHQAMGLNGLGEIACAAGRPTEALTHHGEALTIALGGAIRAQEARADAGLGRAYLALGQQARARPYFERASALYTELRLPDADAVHRDLCSLGGDQT
jgi:DNA-binding SARP family transcriptional activator